LHGKYKLKVDSKVGEILPVQQRDGAVAGSVGL